MDNSPPPVQVGGAAAQPDVQLQDLSLPEPLRAHLKAMGKHSEYSLVVCGDLEKECQLAKVEKEVGMDKVSMALLVHSECSKLLHRYNWHGALADPTQMLSSHEEGGPSPWLAGPPGSLPPSQEEEGDADENGHDDGDAPPLYTGTGGPGGMQLMEMQLVEMEMPPPSPSPSPAPGMHPPLVPSCMHFGTGAAEFDRILGGGLRAGSWTELYGPSSSLLTEVLQSVAAHVTMAHPTATVVYCQAGLTFRAESFLEVLNARYIDERLHETQEAESVLKAALSRLRVEHTPTWEELSVALDRIHMANALRGGKPRVLVIVDGLSLVFTPLTSLRPFPYVEHLLWRQMRRVALSAEVAILTTNHTVSPSGRDQTTHQQRSMAGDMDIGSASSGRYQVPRHRPGMGWFWLHGPDLTVEVEPVESVYEGVCEGEEPDANVPMPVWATVRSHDHLHPQLRGQRAQLYATIKGIVDAPDDVTGHPPNMSDAMQMQTDTLQQSSVA
ncbi:unnamed protein product [Vitrella brassicaformis CCMP3155]|uniref:Rad51-like C-terminal domain-containing protein n=1 Tax=Vitrella brassicaformis (strain CCMP3155) TaxID=1169540 RepID=A0A0G4FDL7_VITBC|nr:unnamed protein product [Vitrella brassicaformis CCMP3155]|eukprot:CEM11043.1 unnamed protein product [Vitrella brassicaformis CCMP3155]